jgi:hypothetical protein
MQQNTNGGQKVSFKILCEYLIKVTDLLMEDESRTKRSEAEAGSGVRGHSRTVGLGAGQQGKVSAPLDKEK